MTQDARERLEAQLNWNDGDNAIVSKADLRTVLDALSEIQAQIEMRISELKGDRRNFDHLSREDQRELDVLRRVQAALAKLEQD